uniref:Uncharacterized protein n=1 Tax=Glossina pallidipes TaxID=7398 RepID=A0A1B0AGJ4_GLOPL
MKFLNRNELHTSQEYKSILEDGSTKVKSLLQTVNEYHRIQIRPYVIYEYSKPLPAKPYKNTIHAMQHIVDIPSNRQYVSVSYNHTLCLRIYSKWCPDIIICIEFRNLKLEDYYSIKQSMDKFLIVH